MADGLEIETKSDRELLLLAVAKLNDMDEKLDSACGNISEQEDKLSNNRTEIELLKHSVNGQKKFNNTIIGIGAGLVLSAILSWFKIE